MKTTKTRFGAGFALATLSALLLTSLAATPALADHPVTHSHGQPDTKGLPAAEHAPIGVMQDHMHNKGEWMVSYRYMHMDMGGSRAGTTSLGTDDVLDRFMVAPLAMDMHMHMLGAMYGLTDKVTIMAMVPHSRKEMSLVTRMGMGFETAADGVGDVKLAAMISLFKSEHHRLHLNAGLSLPTGSISARGDTPMAQNMPLPYAMQIGSGTWDLMPGVTYSGSGTRFYWGAQVRATIRTGKNSNGYRQPDDVMLTGWWMARLTEELDAGLRLAYTHKGRIAGVDARLNPMMVQTANATLSGGDVVNAFVAVNYQFQKGALKGHRLAIEVGMPVYQKLNGPQMEADWSLMTGWQKSF